MNALQNTFYSALRRLLYFQIRHGHEYVERRIRREPDGVLLGTHAYNPALVDHDGKRFCIYRKISGGEEKLCRAEIDGDFHIRADTTVELNDQLSSPAIHGLLEDSRMFRHNGVDYLIYYCNRSLYMVPLCMKQGIPVGPSRLLTPTENGKIKRLEVEKNWTFFEVGGDIYAIYSIIPFRILRVTNWDNRDEPLLCEFFVEHRPSRSIFKKRRNPFGWTSRQYWNPFQWGMLRGGTPPVLVGEHYFIFAHSYSYAKSLGSYSLFGFSRYPPFNITHFPVRPIGFPTTVNSRYSHAYPGLTLMFPCSAHYNELNDEWLVASGRDDYCMEFLHHRHSRILQTCIRVTPGMIESTGPGCN